MIGNLTRDPEIRYSGSGMAITNISVAVQRQFKDKSSGEYETDFFNCTAFRSTAEIIANNFSKGSKIAISGNLQNNNYTKDDGTKVYRDVIIINSVTFVEPKKDQNANKPKQQNNDDPFEKNNDSIDISDSDLPF
jgi:single-strand DNA-binding protein